MVHVRVRGSRERVNGNPGSEPRGGGGAGARRYSVHAMRMRYGGGVRVRRAVVITVIL